MCGVSTVAEPTKWRNRACLSGFGRPGWPVGRLRKEWDVTDYSWGSPMAQAPASAEEMAEVKAELKRLRAQVAEQGEWIRRRVEVESRPRCTCMVWTASMPPMPQSDGTCPVHPVRGLWRNGQPPKES